MPDGEGRGPPEGAVNTPSPPAFPCTGPQARRVSHSTGGSAARRNPPCSHNNWDNVRIKHGVSSLRCRVCQCKWRLHFSQFTRCQNFRRGECNDTCPDVHVHQFKETLASRHERFGKAVLDRVPQDLADAVRRQNRTAAPDAPGLTFLGLHQIRECWERDEDGEAAPPLLSGSSSPADSSSGDDDDMQDAASPNPQHSGHVCGQGRRAAQMLQPEGRDGQALGRRYQSESGGGGGGAAAAGHESLLDDRHHREPCRTRSSSAGSNSTRSSATRSSMSTSCATSTAASTPLLRPPVAAASIEATLDAPVAQPAVAQIWGTHGVGFAANMFGNQPMQCGGSSMNSASAFSSAGMSSVLSTGGHSDLLRDRSERAISPTSASASVRTVSSAMSDSSGVVVAKVAPPQQWPGGGFVQSPQQWQPHILVPAAIVAAPTMVTVAQLQPQPPAARPAVPSARVSGGQQPGVSVMQLQEAISKERMMLRQPPARPAAAHPATRFQGDR